MAKTFTRGAPEDLPGVARGTSLEPFGDLPEHSRKCFSGSPRASETQPFLYRNSHFGRSGYPPNAIQRQFEKSKHCGKRWPTLATKRHPSSTKFRIKCEKVLKNVVRNITRNSHFGAKKLKKIVREATKNRAKEHAKQSKRTRKLTKKHVKIMAHKKGLNIEFIERNGVVFASRWGRRNSKHKKKDPTGCAKKMAQKTTKTRKMGEQSAEAKTGV